MSSDLPRPERTPLLLNVFSHSLKLPMPCRRLSWVETFFYVVMAAKLDAFSLSCCRVVASHAEDLPLGVHVCEFFSLQALFVHATVSWHWLASSFTLE